MVFHIDLAGPRVCAFHVSVTSRVNTESAITTHRVISRGLQLFGLGLCVVLTGIAIRIPHWIPRVTSFITGGLALLLLFFRETHIDVQRGVVVEVCRVLGLIPFFQRTRPIQEYAGISCYCSSGVTDDISDTWMVALSPRRGRPVEVRQFSVTTGSGDCPEARAFARALSKETGLGLIDYVA
jgi:hypothetical protein